MIKDDELSVWPVFIFDQYIRGQVSKIRLYIRLLEKQKTTAIRLEKLI